MTALGPIALPAPTAPATRPLRVLTFLHSFEPGGVERVALRLHSAWAAEGLDSHLVMGRSDGAMAAEWPDLAYELLGDPPFPTARFETLWMIAALPRAIRRLRPDVLFCAGNTYTVVAVAMKLLLGRRCPPILAKISNDLARTDLPRPFRAGYRWWLRIQGRLIDRFVGMAPPMRREVTGALGVGPERVAIVADPSLDCAGMARLAEARTAAHDISSTSPGRHFVAVGRLVPQKNFALLLDAFAAMASPDDRLTILGEGPERDALAARIRRLGLGIRVTLAGHCNPVGPWLARAAALVLSSDYEGVPAVIPEALAAGVPIVATNCSVSMAGLLGNGRFGLLVPVQDAAALAKAMGDIADFSFDAAAARQSARRFTVERAAGTYARELAIAAGVRTGFSLCSI